MASEQFWLVCYDIADKRRLRRIARIMEGYGVRVQESVFECWMAGPAMAALKAEIAAAMAPEQDSVRFYALCQDCQGLSGTQGETEIVRPLQYYIA